MAKKTSIQRTEYPLGLRWAVIYWPEDDDDGMALETLHLTKLGARLSRWLNGASSE